MLNIRKHLLNSSNSIDDFRKHRSSYQLLTQNQFKVFLVISHDLGRTVIA